MRQTLGERIKISEMKSARRADINYANHLSQMRKAKKELLAEMRKSFKHQVRCHSTCVEYEIKRDDLAEWIEDIYNSHRHKLTRAVRSKRHADFDLWEAFVKYCHKEDCDIFVWYKPGYTGHQPARGLKIRIEPNNRLHSQRKTTWIEGVAQNVKDLLKRYSFGRK